MDTNSNLSNSFKTVSVSSMITYLRGLTTENLEGVIKWAKVSKNPNATVITANPNEWEKNMKKIFSQLSLKEQAEVISQATKILEEKKKNQSKK